MATGLKGEARDSRATLRRAGRGVVSTLAGRGVALAATYVFYAILSRSLPVADFGRLVFALTIVRIGATLARRGLDQALLVAMPRGPANRLAVRIIVSTAAALATATILGLLLVQQALPGFAIPLAVALPMVALAELVVGALRARGSVTLAATAEGLAQPLAAVAFAWMAAQAAPSLTTFAVAYLASWLAPILFARRLDWSGPPLDPEAARQFVDAGTAMLGTVVLGLIVSSADVLLLTARSTAVEVGHYGAAQKIAGTLLLLHGAVVAATGPVVRGVAADRDELCRCHRAITRWTLAISLPLLIVMLGTPGLLLQMFGAEYARLGGGVLTLLALAWLAYLTTGPVSTVLFCTGHARLLVRLSAIHAAVLVLAAAVLGAYGAIGTATAVLLSHVLARAMLLSALRRRLGFQPVGTALLAMLAAAAGGVVLARLVAMVAPDFIAAAAGTMGAMAVAVPVLRATGDLAFLRAEMRRYAGVEEQPVA
jgi:O-antigen/teichoic acid export membrane protein